MFVFLHLRGDLKIHGLKLTVLEGKKNILSVLWLFCSLGPHASQLWISKTIRLQHSTHWMITLWIHIYKAAVTHKTLRCIFRFAGCELLDSEGFLGQKWMEIIGMFLAAGCHSQPIMAPSLVMLSLSSVELQEWDHSISSVTGFIFYGHQPKSYHCMFWS